MNGLKRKPQGGGSSSNLPDISGFPTSVAGNVLYDFGNDAEGFYKIPFYDSEENIWKQLAFKEFAQNMKSAFNFTFLETSASPSILNIKDSFIVINSDYGQTEVFFPDGYFNTPRIIQVFNNYADINFLLETRAGNVVMFKSEYYANKGLQTFICFGAEQPVIQVDSEIFKYDFFYSVNANVTEAQVRIQSNNALTDEFLRILIFDGEERNFKYVKLNELAAGLFIPNKRDFKEFVIRGNGTYNIPVIQKGITRIILHEGFSTQQINLALDNVNLDFNAYEGTEIEVFNFSTNVKTFIWGEQQTATNAFTIPASTANNAVGVSARFILLDTMWRKI